ncbi:MAG: bifunctional ADP-dependent NAD(P)H-hydrate dehydratase/NAD(P)H-hydrate epimerase [Thermoprotei archaeon]|nr:MAG: bifunctional ADP-dependent NAD(P)H-hydrate dehydratase/NAD(P)H-hydrate epimerase [Thermoprotei archaeon]
MLTPLDVRRLDINAKWLGVDTSLLMENAGKSVADYVKSKYPNVRKIVVVCGLGNNGGDGFVAARHLASLGYDVAVVLVGDRRLIRTEIAKKNWEILEQMNFSVKLAEVKSESDLSVLEKELEKADVVVDAILGVGIKGAARGLAAKAIEKINSLKKKYKIVAVDVPSGLDVYKGEAEGPVVYADATVTFHDTKKGLEKYGGEIVVASIGIPPEADKYVGPGDFVLIPKVLKRDPWSHKGHFGKVMIVGGSKFFSGAPALAALAALRTGADLAVVYAPLSTAQVVKSFSPNIIAVPLQGEFILPEHVDYILSESEKFDTVAVGPGLSTNGESLKACYSIVSKLAKEKTVVVDADGLKALAKYGIPEGKIVLTPHAGEFYMLFGEKPSLSIVERGKLVQKHAAEKNTVILLKGHVDVISDGSRVKYNTTGNPGMTVGGTGDVLTGILAELTTLTNDLFQAACCAAFISGLAGDLTYKEKGYELVATDVIEKIPEALSTIREFLAK